MGDSATYLLNVPSSIQRKSNPLPRQAAGNSACGRRVPYRMAPSWLACSCELMLTKRARAV
jgi:hypothetical protein